MLPGFMRGEAFRYGGMPIHNSLPTGIYAGRPKAVYKFAEAETRWEAFISGKAGQEKRNQRIAAEAVRRLGGVAQFGPAAGMTAFADGGIAGAQSEVDRLARLERARRAQYEQRLAIFRRDRSNDGKRESSEKAWRAWAEAADDLKRARQDLGRDRSSMGEELTDWRTGLRRGEQRSAGMGGNGLSLVDRAFGVAQDLGGKAGEALRRVALRSESAYLSLEKKATRANEALEKAQDRADDRREKAQDRADALLEKAEDRAATNLEKVTERMQAAVDKAAAKLSDLRSASEAMASSVTNAVRGFFDLDKLATATTKTVTERNTRTVGGITLSTLTQREVEVPVSAKSVKSGLWGQAKRMKEFAAKVKRLTAKGFNQQFVAEVVGMGVEAAEPLIDALLSMSDKDMADVNSLYRTINQAAASSGQAVADANYAKQIAAAEKALTAAEKNAREQIRATKEANERAIRAAKLEGDRLVRQAKLTSDAEIRAAKANTTAVQSALKSETSRIVSAITSALKGSQKRAQGGAVFGPGTATSDSIPALLSNGEHVIAADEVAGAGGHAEVERIRRLMADGTLRYVLDAYRDRMPALAAGGPVVRVPEYAAPSSTADLADAVRGMVAARVVERGSALRGGLHIDKFVAAGITPAEVLDELAWRLEIDT
jgi:hypothetical protein